MPWDKRDAAKHAKAAATPKAKRQWSDVANSVKARGGSDASAVRQANAVVKKRGKSK